MLELTFLDEGAPQGLAEQLSNERENLQLDMAELTAAIETVQAALAAGQPVDLRPVRLCVALALMGLDLLAQVLSEIEADQGRPAI